MQFKTLLKFATVMLFGVFVFALTSCGGNDSATEEEAAAEVEEVTPPPPPPPPPSAKKRSDVTARASAKANETPEEFNAVDETEVETINGVEFLPHRFSYEDPESEHEPLVVSMMAFDTPPIFGNKCYTDDTPDDCSHDALQSYISNRIEYPDEAENFDNMVEYVTFTVKADGSVDGTNIQILPQDPQCHTCAAEALEIIRDMPKWKPAEKDGQPVPAKITVPIRFATE